MLQKMELTNMLLRKLVIFTILMLDITEFAVLKI